MKTTLKTKKPLRTLDAAQLTRIKGGWTDLSNTGAIFVRGAATGAGGTDW